jgi:glycosyltransferase involved in cell wall biosynthesis
MSRLAGAERTLRLALRYLKHLKRGDSRELRSLTLQFLYLRLFRSRAHRRALFRSSVEDHLGAALPSTSLPCRAPKVSVCMAAYNGGKYVDMQLRSILPQLGPEDEIVVVDDCSTDNTRERIRALGDVRIHLLEHTRNQGVVQTFEDALRNATGDILFLSDDDDLWAPDKVKQFMAVFAQGEEVQLVMSAVALIDWDGTPFRDARWDRDGRFSRGFWRNVLKNRYQGAALAIRSILVQEVLPIKRGRTYLHDVWIGTCNDRIGGGMVYLPMPMLLYRRHAGNFSRKLTRWAQLKSRLQLLWDHALRSL